MRLHSLSSTLKSPCDPMQARRVPFGHHPTGVNVATGTRPLLSRASAASASAFEPERSKGAQPQQPLPPPAVSASPGGADADSSTPSSPGFLGKLKRLLLGDKKLDRQRLAELGMGAFAAYGVISNLNAGVLLTIAWLTVVKTQGATPLAPGMWPKFLAVYAGLWISSHFMRPIRLSLAIAAAPAFDKVLGTIQERTGANKAMAFALMLACIAVGSFTVIGSVIFLAGGFSV